MKKILLSILLFMLAITPVFAFDAGGDYSGGSITDFTNGGGKTNWPYPYVSGIRVSFVNANGQSYNRSMDYIHPDDYEKIIGTQVKYISAPCHNKASYRNSYCTQADPFNASSWTTATIGNIASSSKILEAAFNAGSKSYSINLEWALSNWNYSNLFDSILPENNQWQDKESYQADMSAIFSNLYGSKIEDRSEFYHGKELNVFIVIEPVTVVKINGTLYYGTSYELAAIASSSKGGGFTDKCSGSNAICDVSSVLAKKVPCASYLDGGSLHNKLQNTTLAGWFPVGGYFGGAITASSSNYSNYKATCNASKSKFNDSTITGNDGVGIGILWLGDILKKDDLSCDIVNSGIKWNIKGTIENAYKSPAGLSSFYNSYAGGINYTKPDGTTGKVDAQWYVNECTCYGIYDNFDKIYIPSWKSQWQAEIQALGTNSILGPNWFDRLNTVKMNDLTPARVNSVLSGSITTTYNNSLQRHVEDLNRKSTDITYTWTPWTIDKYNKLDCGTTTYKDQCTHLEQWYNTNKPSNYANLTGMTVSQLLSTNQYYWQASNMFKAYNTIYANATGVYWDHAKYISQCLEGIPGPDPEPTNYNCTPKYNVGTCINGDTIEYLDTSNSGQITDEYWKNCVFSDDGIYDINTHKTSSGSGKMSYHEENLGSSYCSVYCIESLTANFDDGNFTVKAGNNFVWGNSVVKGSRTCKTKSIEWDTFKQELTNWNTEIERAYNEYLVAKYQQNSIKTESTICSRRCGTEPCPTEKNPNKRCPKYCDYIGKEYSWEGKTYGSGDTLASGSSGSSSCGSRPDFSVSSKYSAYNNIKNNANAAYNSMVSCYTWNEDNVYKVNPSLTLNYSDGYYNYSDTMDKGSTSYNMTQNTVNQCKNTTVPVLTGCSGTKCTTQNKSIKQCESVTMTRESTTHFKISSDAYRYVLKSSHVSIHANELSNYTDPKFTTNYTDVGYGNLPVSYGTKDGVYGVGNRGELSIDYSKLGHIRSGDNSTAVDDILKTIQNSYGKWECQYSVESELIPDKPTNNKNSKGINVIYRPIDLFDPFPDMDATGRETGANWCAYNDCSSRNNTVNKYILNNRGVANDDVYQKEPMYTFVITPAVAKEIRRYNKENGYDEYTGSLNNNSYDYVCKKGTGGTCISEYLTHIIDITNARNEPGSCVQNTNRNVNDSASFENCRY